MLQINENQRGIVLVVDDELHLLDTFTDGDLRRAILNRFDLNTPLADLADRRIGSDYPEPVTVLEGTTEPEVSALMSRLMLRHVPVVDKEGHVKNLIVAGDTASGSPPELPVSALIMAGGLGTRLRPLTDRVPKPLLLVGDKPIMEDTVRQLRDAGVRQLFIATHYKAEAIEEHFGDGSNFDISIDYVKEEQPLGTAGALGLMEPPTEPLLVVNGDVLTRVNYRAMHAFHQDHKADMTVGLGQYEFQVPYGVVETDGSEIKSLSEKPRIRYFINAGAYLLEPSVLTHIPEGQRFDMTDLIQALMDAGRRVVGFPISEYWLDVGHHGDYEQANTDMREGLR
jgi:dTDP-glucose pyrophosphorylase